MFGRKGRSKGAAHIKANTVGTSNEISFNVLENARDNLDSDKNPNVVKVRRAGRSVGVVSLLFSKIRFPSKNEGRSKTSSAVAKAAATAEPSPLPKKTKAARIAAPEKTDAVQASARNSARAAKQERKTARAEAHAQAKEARRRRHAEKHSLSRDEVQSAPYSQETAQAEVERRKKIRRRRRIRLRIVVATGCIAAVCCAGYYFYHQYQLHSDQSSLLAEAMREISAADEGLVQLDELLSDPLGEVDGDDWKQLHGDYSTVKAHLSSASSIASELVPLLADGEMKTAAGQVVDACTARSTMLDVGEEIFDAAAAARQVADDSNSVWNKVLDADSAAREGVSLLSSGSIDASMGSAKEKIGEASTAFSNLITSLADLEASYNGLDFSAQRAYLNKRIEALGYASATAQALIDRDKATASALAEKYNAADAEATKMAADLPEAPAEAVNAAFEKNIETDRQRYSNARYAATQADGIIRDYLGV